MFTWCTWLEVLGIPVISPTMTISCEKMCNDHWSLDYYFGHNYAMFLMTLQLFLICISFTPFSIDVNERKEDLQRYFCCSRRQGMINVSFVKNKVLSRMQRIPQIESYSIEALSLFRSWNASHSNNLWALIPSYLAWKMACKTHVIVGWWATSKVLKLPANPTWVLRCFSRGKLDNLTDMLR